MLEHLVRFHKILSGEHVIMLRKFRCQQRYVTVTLTTLFYYIIFKFNTIKI